MVRSPPRGKKLGRVHFLTRERLEIGCLELFSASDHHRPLSHITKKLKINSCPTNFMAVTCSRYFVQHTRFICFAPRAVKTICICILSLKSIGSLNEIFNLSETLITQFQMDLIRFITIIVLKETIPALLCHLGIDCTIFLVNTRLAQCSFLTIFCLFGMSCLRSKEKVTWVKVARL